MFRKMSLKFTALCLIFNINTTEAILVHKNPITPPLNSFHIESSNEAKAQIKLIDKIVNAKELYWGTLSEIDKLKNMMNSAAIRYQNLKNAEKKTSDIDEQISLQGQAKSIAKRYRELEQKRNELKSNLEEYKAYDKANEALNFDFIGTVEDLVNDNIKKLSNSIIHLFITAYDMEKFASNLAYSLMLNHKRLSQYNTTLKVWITCDGRWEDFTAFSTAFERVRFPSENIKIKLNVLNRGCARTRLEQLLKAKQEIRKNIFEGKNVWFSIFDGDDMLHQDSLLVRTAVALQTNADAVRNPRHFAKCNERKEDLHGLYDLLTTDINDEYFLVRESFSVSDFTDNLLNAKNLYVGNNIYRLKRRQEADVIDFSTLKLALDPYYSNIVDLFSPNTQNNTTRVLDALFVDDILTDESKLSYNPLLLYMQQCKSLEHSKLESFLKTGCGSVEDFRKYLDKKITNYDYDMNDVKFLFGSSSHINERFYITPKQNAAMTKDKLLEAFKNNHLLAKEMVNFLDRLIARRGHYWKRLKQELTENANVQSLLKQDLGKPLSPEFMDLFYAGVFKAIFRK